MSDAGTVGRARTSTTRRALLVAVALLAVASVFGGLLVHRARADEARSRVQQQRYAAVLAAARAEADAFVNLRYDRAGEGLSRVATGATGSFARRYGAGSDHVRRTLRRNHSVMAGAVVWAGVVSVARDRATVIVATSGSVTNRRTHGHPVARNYRLKLDLVQRDGQWLTSRLGFVG